MAASLYSTRAACAMLGIDRTTLLRWLHRAGMQSMHDPADMRITGYTRSQLVKLAKDHHRALDKPPAEPEPSRRMRELEHEGETLKARVARIEAHLGLV